MACPHYAINKAEWYYYSINLACLDDLDPSELADAPVNYFDGRNNNWQSPPAETRHL